MTAPVSNVPGTGEMVYLKSVLTNVHIFGCVSDGETPDQFCATLEIAGDNASMSLAALVGPKGPPGQNAFALRLQRSIIDDPEDLPQNLTDDEEDIGKYWVLNHYDTQDEQHQVTITGSPDDGVWTYGWQGESEVTEGLAPDATAADVQSAIEALSYVGAGNVTVEGVAGGPYLITYAGALGSQDIPHGIADGTALEGGTAPAATCTVTVEGGSVLTGSRAYIWFGDHYKVLMMGSQGPVGPVPAITWRVELLDPDGSVDSYMQQTGTMLAPTVTAYLKVPRGPQGPATNLGNAPDVDLSTPPSIGQVLGFAGNYTGSGDPIFEPISVGAIVPRPYIVPEAAFNNFEGLSTRAPIGSFAVPAQDFPWKPVVFGKIRATGLELDSDPLIIGCEVRLGHPTTGQLVARGFGNVSSWTILTPHTSTPSSPSDAMTPDNDTGLVPANHTGNDGTLYINLYNDGLTGVYLFNKQNAQLFVQVTPV
ncbi:hypothetical protein SEA_TYPHA_26 [Mycobacterium phage Typha]|uniref:Minor tail protein n=1 Tax=Mycobacterium phage Typha TaxID=2517971 RepID=A0A482J7Z3_9CAUD|nr:minor tail protein [Mycobacterium phage Typha]QBP29683.1 hypothetical protein SEA_TYPHA_26 [Mycobacterium phage Typha]URM86470.1 minor tail protein [Mycobacterium phage Hilltopfarm]